MPYLLHLLPVGSLVLGWLGMSYQNIVKGVCLMVGRFYDFQRLDTCKL